MPSGVGTLISIGYEQPLPGPIPELEAAADTAWPAHNDWAYYRRDGYPRSIIWSAVCLHDCTEQRGPIHVWPGSHVRHLPHEETERGLEIPHGEINHNGGRDLEAPAGSVLLFHSLLVHNSRHNTSGRPRRLMLYAHYPESEHGTYFDARNGPTRYREYMRRRRSGEYTDRFQAP